MLKANYLSFFNKKDLTNGIHGPILCAMNATEMSPKAKVRLNRIKIVSEILRVLSFVCFLYFGLCTLFGIGSWLGQGAVMKDTGNPIFAPQYHNIENIYLVGCSATLGLLAWFGFKLFRLYERGQLFSPGNINYLRKIAGAAFLLACEASLATAFKNPNHHAGELSTWATLATGAVPAFLILFFAWIMDEGRKIQEEQELTV
jgi:hypothetical protein